MDISINNRDRIAWSQKVGREIEAVKTSSMQSQKGIDSEVVMTSHDSFKWKAKNAYRWKAIEVSERAS